MIKHHCIILIYNTWSAMQDFHEFKNHHNNIYAINSSNKQCNSFPTRGKPILILRIESPYMIRKLSFIKVEVKQINIHITYKRNKFKKLCNNSTIESIINSNSYTGISNYYISIVELKTHDSNWQSIRLYIIDIIQYHWHQN